MVKCRFRRLLLLKRRRKKLKTGIDPRPAGTGGRRNMHF
jgi:hypothetical protein